jgi:hypothetical protein
MRQTTIERWIPVFDRDHAMDDVLGSLTPSVRARVAFVVSGCASPWSSGDRVWRWGDGVVGGGWSVESVARLLAVYPAQLWSIAFMHGSVADLPSNYGAPLVRKHEEADG